MGRKQLESRDLRPAGELVALADIAAMILREDSDRRMVNGTVLGVICHLGDGASFFGSSYYGCESKASTGWSYHCGLVRCSQLMCRPPSEEDLGCSWRR
jgi:hypothetical protein